MATVFYSSANFFTLPHFEKLCVFCAVIQLISDCGNVKIAPFPIDDILLAMNTVGPEEC